MRHPAVQMAASAFVTVGVLVVAEAGMRWSGVPDPGLYEGDRATVWWLRGGLDRTLVDPATHRSFDVRTSDQGFRGAGPPDSGAWTLTMGCSTTFGWAVDEAEAWPAQLAELADMPVVNGGVPGWSTAQAVRGLDHILESVAHNPPARVILAFGVRDAQAAVRRDSAAQPTPLLLQTRWALLLGRARASAAERGAAPTGQRRVSPDEFGENLLALVERVEQAGAHARVMIFPQPGDWPPPGYGEAARSAAGSHWLEAPNLPRSAFFEDDPIHLTPSGHAQLAAHVAGAPR